ncbi:MAG: Hpt domain-containing protein [Rubrivivax sp.]|nr:Hpt domain-containing protein [Rubrivivax sp.]MCW5612320.1 Hpt domain-containing protein [Rubrivivax sp.]
MNAPTPGPAHLSAALPAAELDAAALARLHELDPDGRQGIVQRVLSAFDSSLTRMLVQLGADPDRSDAAVVAALAHQIKSSAGAVGALALSAACAEVERRLRDGQPGDLAADVRRLVAEGEAAREAVRAMLRA